MVVRRKGVEIQSDYSWNSESENTGCSSKTSLILVMIKKGYTYSLRGALRKAFRFDGFDGTAFEFADVITFLGEPITFSGQYLVMG